MAALFALVLLGIAGAVVVGLFAVAWLVLKLVFLPIRLAIGAVKLVVGLVAGLLGGIAMLALAPVLAVVVGGAALVAVVVAVLALLLPLLPFLLLGGLIWAFMRRPRGRGLRPRAITCGRTLACASRCAPAAPRRPPTASPLPTAAR